MMPAPGLIALVLSPVSQWQPVSYPMASVQSEEEVGGATPYPITTLLYAKLKAVAALAPRITFLLDPSRPEHAAN